MLHMYDALLTMNGLDLLFEWCTRERYEILAHRRSRLICKLFNLVNNQDGQG
jgi:hypothetical protein